MTESWNFIYISILAGTGCQQSWQGHPGKEQKYFFDFNKAIYVTKILKYPPVVHPYMKYMCSSEFQVPGMILQFLILQVSRNI